MDSTLDFTSRNPITCKSLSDSLTAASVLGPTLVFESNNNTHSTGSGAVQFAPNYELQGADSTVVDTSKGELTIPSDGMYHVHVHSVSAASDPPIHLQLLLRLDAVSAGIIAADAEGTGVAEATQFMYLPEGSVLRLNAVSESLCTVSLTVQLVRL